MHPVSPSGSYYQPPKKEAPATASSMQGRSIDPHPEKSSIFKDIKNHLSSSFYDPYRTCHSCWGGFRHCE